MRAGIRLKLTLLAMAFLLVPAMGYYSTLQIKSFLVRSMESSQLSTAQAVASVLKGRYDLFKFRPEAAMPSEMDMALYILPSASPISADGATDDWPGRKESARRFGNDSLLMKSGAGLGKGGFSIAMASWEGFLFILLEVADEKIIFPEPGRMNPEKADHAWLEFSGAGQAGRVFAPVSSAGKLSFFTKDEKKGWRPLDTLKGAMAQNREGYVMEIALPLEYVSEGMWIKAAVSDTDQPMTRRTRSLVGPSEDGQAGLIRLSFPESREIQDLLEELDFFGGSVMVADRFGRIRARVAADGGKAPEGGTLDKGHFAHGALPGPLSVTTNLKSRTGDEMIAAKVPILGAKGEAIGAVLVERSTAIARSMQAKAARDTLQITLLAFILVAAVLAISASRLALRIHRLRADAESAIDPAGRVVSSAIEASKASGDEIGDLSRSISGMLKRLEGHHDFLAALPRTLKHEITNPLNTITMSLQNLAEEKTDEGRKKYIQSAGRGVARLKEMVDNLAEAASVEDSIRQEKFEKLSLARLLARYMENSALVNRRHSIRLSGAPKEAFIAGSDFRMEQMLDKLMDNALDFTPQGGVIEAGLEPAQEGWLMSFSNQGPPAPDHMLERMFDSLVSLRSGGSNGRPHLGMGLHIVKVIAEGHGGAVSCRNRADGSGVEFLIYLPSA